MFPCQPVSTRLCWWPELKWWLQVYSGSWSRDLEISSWDFSAKKRMPKAPKITTLGVHIKTTGAGPTKHLCHWFSSPKPKLGWWLRIHPWPWNNWEKSCERKKFIPSYTILSNYYHPLIYIYIHIPLYPHDIPLYPAMNTRNHMGDHEKPFPPTDSHSPASKEPVATLAFAGGIATCNVRRWQPGGAGKGRWLTCFNVLGFVWKKITLQKPQKKTPTSKSKGWLLVGWSPMTIPDFLNRCLPFSGKKPTQLRWNLWKMWPWGPSNGCLCPHYLTIQFGNWK